MILSDTAVIGISSYAPRFRLYLDAVLLKFRGAQDPMLRRHPFQPNLSCLSVGTFLKMVAYISVTRAFLHPVSHGLIYHGRLDLLTLSFLSVSFSSVSITIV